MTSHPEGGVEAGSDTRERNGLYFDLPEAEYHAAPELSSTGARTILDTPARFDWARTHRVETKAFDLGHVAHAKVLGVGLGIAVIPEGKLAKNGAASTKDAKAFIDTAKADGLVPIKPHEWAYVNRLAEAVLAHKEARRILENGCPEVSAFATDPETGVACRARIDYLTSDTAADLKTTAGSASSTGFGISAAKFGYPIQEGWYLDVLRWVTGLDDPKFRFIVVEKSAPHLVAVHAFDDMVREAARELGAKARRVYAECMASGDWPGYGDGVIQTELPAWWWNYVDNDEQEITF